jgi:uncharacterized surface protein with fasciclin (FAS1) repeats
MIRILTFTCVITLIALAGCAEPERPAEPEPTNDVDTTVVDAAEQAGLTTLAALISEAELVDVLSGDGPFTVFGPSDEAFAALDEATVNTLRQPENRDALRAVLTYHVVSGTYMSGDLSGERTVETVNGESITISATDEGVTLTDALGNTATVISADLDADNGVLHVIDAVMLPATPGDLLAGDEVDADAVEGDVETGENDEM